MAEKTVFALSVHKSCSPLCVEGLKVDRKVIGVIITGFKVNFPLFGPFSCLIWELACCLNMLVGRKNIIERIVCSDL